MVQPEDGPRAHSYSQAVAVTGRLSSNDPNLQNIPIRTAEGRRIREAFIAPPGSQIVSADYSQIELRIMAHISRRREPAEGVRAGEDIHRATAAEVFGMPPDEVDSEQRRYAKVINFGLIYGMSRVRRWRRSSTSSARAAQPYMDRYFARYPGVKRVHGAHAQARARARLRRDGVRAAAVAARHPQRQHRRAARAPSARRSTRRCRAPRPT